MKTLMTNHVAPDYEICLMLSKVPPPIPQKPTKLTSRKVHLRKQRSRLSTSTFESPTDSDQSIYAISLKTSRSSSFGHSPNKERKFSDESLDLKDSAVVLPAAKEFVTPEKKQDENLSDIADRWTNADTLKMNGSKNTISNRSLSPVPESQPQIEGLDHDPSHEMKLAEKYKTLSSLSLRRPNRPRQQPDIRFMFDDVVVNADRQTDMNVPVKERPVNAPSSSQATHQEVGIELELPEFDAVALYPFEADPSCNELVSVLAKENVTIYSTCEIKASVLRNLTESQLRDYCHLEGGWCYIKKKDGSLGFAPISYFEFLPDRSREQLPLRTPVGTTHTRRTRERSFNTIMRNQTEPNLIKPSISQSHTTPHALNHQSSTIFPNSFALPSKLGHSFVKWMHSWFDPNISVNKFLQGPEQVQQKSSRSSLLGDRDLESSYELTDGFKWKPVSMQFHVTVRTPRKRKRYGVDPLKPNRIYVEDEFITYNVSCWIPNESGNQEAGYSKISVERRYSDFEWLHDQLSKIFPPAVVALPPLPLKHFAKRQEASFIEQRRQELESYLSSITRHPLVGCEEVVSIFLSSGSDRAETNISWRKVIPVLSERYEDPIIFSSCESVTAYEDEEWEKAKKEYANRPIQTHEEFIQKATNHPFMISNTEFEEIAAFEMHLDLLNDHLMLVLDSVQGFMDYYERLPSTYDDLSVAFEALCRGTLNDKDQIGRSIRDLSWCWKPGCQECRTSSNQVLTLSKQFHKLGLVMSHHYHNDMQPFFAFLEGVRTRIRNMTKSRELLVDLQRKLLSIRAESYQSRPEKTDILTRINKLIGVLMAEINWFHDEKCNEWQKWTKLWIDSQIQAQERVLQHMKAVRDIL